MLKFYLLGPPRIELNDEPVQIRRRKALALLVYLAVTGRPHSRDALATLFYPDLDQSRARAYFRRDLGALNTQLGGDWLTADREMVGLNQTAGVWMDLAQFRHDLVACDSHGHGKNDVCPDCLPLLATASDLYTDHFLAGFSLPDCPEFDEWQFFETENLRQELAKTLNLLVAGYMAQRQYEGAIPYARRLLNLDPLHEPAHRHLMKLYALSGQHAAALRQYDNCVTLLDEELGLAPEEETTRLYEEIKARRLDKLAAGTEAFQSALGGEISPDITPYQPDIQALPTFLLEDDTPDPVPPAFVARERELAQLDKHFEAALSGHGRVVFITGEAGQGKTTMLNEFTRRALSANPELIVAGGNCDAYAGVGDPYLPFREVLGLLGGDVESRLAAGVIGRDQAERLWRLMPDTALALAQDGPDLVGVFISGPPLVDRLATGQGSRPAWLNQLEDLAESGRVTRVNLEQSYLFEQYVRILRELAGGRPLLITLDDLQWADAGSIGLLFHLGRRLEGIRILILGAYRPDEVALGRDGDHHPLEKVLGEFKRTFGDVWLDLAEAERVEGRFFVDVLLDSEPNRLDESFRRVLLEYTGGHPLFTVELLRTMKERGDLVQVNGEWITGTALNWKTMPVRVEGVIEERIGRLEPELRELLSTASVEGEEFTAEVLARVLGIDQRQLLRQLSQDLEKRHRLVQERGAISVGRWHLSRFRFGHLLFQRYFYDELGDGQRRLLHGEIGQALEALYEGQTDEKASQLAYHFLKAGEREKAIEYALRAARRAQALYAHQEAIQHLQTALDLLENADQAETRLELLEGLADVHSVFTTDTQAISYYQAALEIWSSLTGADNMIAVRLHRKILEFGFQLHGNVAREFFDPLSQTLAPSQAYLEARLSLVHSEQPRLEWVRVLAALANITDSGPTGVRSPEDLDAAEGYAQAAVDLAEQLDAPVELSDALEALGKVYFVRGMLPEQLEVSHRRLTLSRDPRFSDLRKRSYILESLSDALIAVGQYDQALSFLLELENLTDQMGAIVDHIWALGLQALCLFRLDRWEEIFRLDEKRQELEGRHSSVQLGGGYCVILSLTAAARALQGDLDQARVQREQAYAFMLGGAEGPPDNWARTEYY